MSKIEFKDIYDFKLKIYYKDSKVVRKYYFDSYFKLFKFIYKQLHKQRVEKLEVEKLDV